MTDPDRTARRLQTLDLLQDGSSPLHRADPLLKLLLTLLFIVITVSFGKYDLSGLLVLVLFPLFFYQLADLPLLPAFRRLRWLLLPVLLLGAVNPLLDRAPFMQVGSITVSGGLISGLTLLVKGLLCLLAAFLLLATTRPEDLTRALRRLHLPQFLTSLLLLTLRYLGLLTEEARSMSAAYALRAPQTRGVRFRDWGPFLGHLLLRSLDRAQTVYDSMLLRGFNGELPGRGLPPADRTQVLTALLIAALLVLTRLVNLAGLLAGALLK